MSDHGSPRTSRLREIGRAGAVVAAGVIAFSGIAAGTAAAAEGYGDTGSTEGGAGFTPTTPVDGFVYHWGKYHYGEENFVGSEVNRVTSDPGRYVDIHLDMVKMMLGESPEGTMDMGTSDY